MVVAAVGPAIRNREPSRWGQQYRNRGSSECKSRWLHPSLVANASAVNATLYEKLNFNFIHDIAPVAGIMRGPQILVVNPAVPAKTVPEFIAYAKANPGKLNFASPGNGTSFHVAGEMFKMMAGVNMIHVPYRGGGDD
jgi:tripartite-type tricarboxylate transporter receptor subunit TctC